MIFNICEKACLLFALGLVLPAAAQNKPVAPPAKTAPVVGNSGPADGPTKSAATPMKPGTRATVPANPGDKAQAPAKPGDKTPAPDKPLYVKPRRPLGAVTALAFSPDGKKLALGTFGQVVLYDTTTWQSTDTYRQVTDNVRALAFHPEGQMLAVGSGLPGRSGLTTLWDTTGAQKPRPYPAMYDTIESITFRRDGKGMLLGADDNKACYYPDLLPTNNTMLEAHNGRVQAVACSPKNNYIFITGAMDKIVKVWDEKTRTNVVNFDQSEGGITGLAFLNNGDQFVGSSLDGRLYWWGVSHDEKKNTYSGYRFRTVDAHAGGVFALGQSKDGNRFASGGADNRVCVWNTDNGGRIREFKDSTQPIYAVALTPEGKIAAGGGREGVVFIWDVEANKLLNVLIPPALPVSKPVSKTVAANPKADHKP